MKYVTSALVGLAMCAAPGVAGAYDENAPRPEARAPVAVTLNGGFSPDPHNVEVTAGGPRAAAGADLGEGCVGYIGEAPNVTLTFNGAGALFLSASAAGDTTMVVRAPDGTHHCNDDSGGDLNPLVSFDAAAAGEYRIFMGTFEQGAEGLAATVHISMLGGGPGISAELLPDPDAAPTQGEVTLASGFRRPHVARNIQAGGPINARMLRRATCWGHVARAPDYRVNFTAGADARALIIAANAASDTTLIVRDASGQWLCDDDGGVEGLDPAITLAAPTTGRYDIWVGAFSEGPRRPATLRISQPR